MEVMVAMMVVVGDTVDITEAEEEEDLGEAMKVVAMVTETEEMVDSLAGEMGVPVFQEEEAVGVRIMVVVGVDTIQKVIKVVEIKWIEQELCDVHIYC